MDDCWILYACDIPWEYYWYRIDALLLLFGLFPLLTIEGIKVKLEEKRKDKNIDIIIMGEVK